MKCISFKLPNQPRGTYSNMHDIWCFSVTNAFSTCQNYWNEFLLYHETPKGEQYSVWHCQSNWHDYCMHLRQVYIKFLPNEEVVVMIILNLTVTDRHFKIPWDWQDYTEQSYTQQKKKCNSNKKAIYFCKFHILLWKLKCSFQEHPVVRPENFIQIF